MAETAVIEEKKVAKRKQAADVVDPKSALEKVEEQLKQKEETKVTAPKDDRTEWRFVKNLNTAEKITFEDGEKHQFKKNLFVCNDPILAAKILAVAQKYGIVEQ